MMGVHNHKTDDEKAKCPICATLDALVGMVDLDKLPTSVILLTATDDLDGVGFQASGHLSSIIRAKLVLIRALEAIQAQEAEMEAALRGQFMEAQMMEAKQHLKN